MTPGKTALTDQPARSTQPLSTFHSRAWSGWGLALFTTFCFSTMPPVIKTALNLGLNPPQILMLRYLLATVLLGVTLAIFAPRRLRADRRLIQFASIGGLGYAAAVLLYSYSLTRLSASVASMTFSLYPLLVLGVLAVMGEKFTYRNIIRLALGLAGVYLLIGLGGHVDIVGLLLVFGAMSAMLVYLFSIQWRLGTYDPLAVALYLVASMTAAIGLIWLLQGAPWVNPGWGGWLAVGWMAVIGTYLAQMTMVSSVRLLGSGQVALLNPVETFLTVIWSVLFLAEYLTPLQWVGGGLILFSALLSIRRLRRARVVKIEVG